MDETNSLKMKPYQTGISSFTLEDFARNYITEAIRIAQEGPTVNQYDQRIVEAVSTRMKMSHEEVRQLQKPFYWVLMNGNGNSVFKRVNPKTPGEESRVQLNPEYQSSVDTLVDKVLTKEQCDYLDGRIRRMLVSRFDCDIVGNTQSQVLDQEEIYR